MEWKTMIRKNDLEQLHANWAEQMPLKGTSKERDFTPCVKLFGGAVTILLTECDADGLAFGAVDLGMGFELGYISMDEIAAIRIGGIFPLEQDLYFDPKGSLSSYTR